MSRQKILDSRYTYKEQDPEYMGEELDPEYSEGPVVQRPCRDLFCCIAFIALLVGMGIIAYLGYQKGDPKLLASPFDSDGKRCKYEPGYELYDKIFISVVPVKAELSFVCVSKCPENNASILDCKTTKAVQNCSDLYIYPSTDVVTLCVPTEITQFPEILSGVFHVPLLQQYFSDLMTAKYIVAIVVGFSLLFSLVYTVLIRLCAKVFIWTFIILFILFMAGLGVFAFLLSVSQEIQNLVHYQELPETFRDKTFQIIVGCVCLLISLITFLTVCCMLRQIKISIGLVKAASDFTRQECSALLLPLYATILQIAFLVFWIPTILFIISSTKDVQQISGTPFGFVAWDDTVRYFAIVYVVGLIWIITFFSGLATFWTCSTVAIWYFQNGEPTAPILRSILRSFKSMGSIAFGSFLITLVIIIKIVLQFQQLKQKTLNADPRVVVARFFIKCAACCIACFERIIRFMTNQAYIMMAISGKGFCSSAKEAFYLMLRSTSQYAVSHTTTALFMGLGKIFIVALCCLCGYLLVIEVPDIKDRVFQPLFLVIIFAFAAYPIASAFMNFFSMAAQTLLMCYCMDMEMHKDSNTRCPPALKHFLQEYVQMSSEYSTGN